MASACEQSPGKLSVYDISTHTMEFVDLPEVHGELIVGCMEKDLGLVCVHPKSGLIVIVGNPVLEISTWRNIPLLTHPKRELRGVALRHKSENFFAYRMFAFSLHSEDGTIQIDAFDSESGLWTSKEPWKLCDGKRVSKFMFMVDGSKAYMATDLVLDSVTRCCVGTYDMDRDEYAMLATGALREKGGWDSESNHSTIDPTLVVCQGSLYVIGRTYCHRFLRVWRLVLETMVCVADYAYPASNTTILFASNGTNKIFARSREHVIEYDVVSNEWMQLAGPDPFVYRLGSKMISGSLLIPSKPLIVKSLEVTGQTPDCFLRSRVHVWLFRRDSTVRSLNSPIYCWRYVAAVLAEMDLVCVAVAGPVFPDKICIGNSITCGWEEVCIALKPEMIRITGREDNATYDPLPHEFIGVTMKQQQQVPGYYIYYFYLERGKLAEGSKVHVHRYDSLTRSWDEPVDPCRVDARSYGWVCAVSGGSSSCKDKIYLSSIQSYRKTNDDPPLPKIAGPKRYKKMRAVAYDSVKNVWDDAVLPKAGVCSPCVPDPLYHQVTCNIVVCNGKLFVVGTVPVNDHMREDTVGIWEVKAGSGAAELVTTLKARAWGGSILLATDGFNKIFVSVEENKRGPVRDTNRVMEYDLENKQWTCYPFGHCNIGCFIAE